MSEITIAPDPRPIEPNPTNDPPRGFRRAPRTSRQDHGRLHGGGLSIAEVQSDSI